MKIGIDDGEDLKFRLEIVDGDVVVVDNNGYVIVRFQIDNNGKVFLSTVDGIDEKKYAINKKKGHTGIEVIS